MAKVQARQRSLDARVRGGEVRGLKPHIRSDLYHFLLTAPWWSVLAAFIAVWLSINLLFALCYLGVGGITGARPGSLFDAFNFSVETISTVGYGGLVPAGSAAHVLVAVESMVGTLLYATVTGLVFAKFSKSYARVMFTECAVINMMDGVPTLMFRTANQRRNLVVEAQISVTMVSRKDSKEGQRFYRTDELALRRSKTAAFTRTWTVVHPIDEKSPLFGATPETLESADLEIIVNLSGLDGTSMQMLHASHSYEAQDLRWGYRHRDLMIDLGHDQYALDFSHFDELVPTEPTPGFPYPKSRPL